MTEQSLSASANAETGPRPTGQAREGGLDAPRIDPARIEELAATYAESAIAASNALLARRTAERAQYDAVEHERDASTAKRKAREALLEAITGETGDYE